MNKKRMVCILGVILIGIGMGMKNSYQLKQESQIQTIPVVEGDVSLCELNEEPIVAIEIKDEETTILKKQNGKWLDLQEPNLEYDQRKIKEIIKLLKDLKSKEIIGPVDNVSNYGLNENSKLITIYDAQNHSQTFKIGNIVAEEDKIYIQKDASGYVYSLDYETIEELFASPSVWIDKNIYSFSKGQLNHIEINSKDMKSLQLEKEDNQWFLKGYYQEQHALNEKDGMEIIEEIQNLEKDSLAGKVTKDKDYGLLEPSMTITLNKTQKLIFGHQENGLYYMQIQGEPYVYRVAQKRLYKLLEMKPFHIIEHKVYTPLLENVEQVSLQNPQKTYILKLDEQAQVEGQKEITLNGKSLTLYEGEELLNFIEESVQLEAQLQNPQIEQKEERKAEIVICYLEKEGKKTMIELIPYDTNFYILRFNGEIEFAVNKDKITLLFNTLAEKSTL